MSNQVIFRPKNREIQESHQELELNNFNSLTISGECIPTSNTVQLKTVLSRQYKIFDDNFRDVEAQINSFNLIVKSKDGVYKILGNFVEHFIELIRAAGSESEIHEQCMKTLEKNIANVKMHVQEKIKKVDTSYKRNKQLKEAVEYVEPIEKAIGFKWHTTQNLETNLPDHTIKQTSFQYIPIKKTLQQLFAQPNFKEEFFDYNLNGKHVCQDGVYERFCCSDTHKKCKLFEDKTAIQIRLAVDDCDVCDPVKSKSVIHKLNCVYLTIDNLPEKYLSKTDNLFLVSLCEATNLKAENKTFDEIAALIVNEIKELETVGIEVDERMIKGSLVRFLSDNLGANQSCGLVESFNSFFCRLCETSKEQSQFLVKEEPQLIRTKESYQKCMQAAAEFNRLEKPIDFKVTKGIKRPCIFNELQNFHILDNPTMDVMHDVNEGVIPFFLQKLFDYCDSKKIVKKSEISRLIRDYNYGFLHKQNKPSVVNFERSNLGQNAKQIYSIMIHLPFIFAKYRDQLKDVWIAMENLLKAMQIIYSHRICEDDLANLTKYIELHYKLLIKLFNAMLKPKHHNVLHYPNTIRKTGPIIYSWMMRFEAKHQFFTRAAKNTNNFINIAKTLAKKHQEAVSYRIFTTDVIKVSKTGSNFNKCKNFSEFMDQVAKFLGYDVLNKLKVLNFAHFNCFEYRNGSIIISNDNVYEIVQVLSNEDQILLFCCPYIVKRYCSFLNSIEIERTADSVSDYIVIDLKNLKNPRSYERKICENKFYIICDTLDFKNFMQI